MMAPQNSSDENEPAQLDSTRDLIHRVRSGDEGAESQLFNRFLPILTRWARGRIPRRSRDLVETDDLVQVTLSRAFRRLESFEPRRQGAFLAYLHRILINCLHDQAKRAHSTPWHEPVDINQPDERAAVIERTMGLGMVGQYEAALQSLTEDQQNAVILRLEFGLPYKEIAEALGSDSPDAVRMQVGRAVIRLAEFISEEPSDPETVSGDAS